MTKLVQVRIPSKMLREHLLEEAILLKLEGILLESIHADWSLSKKYILLIDDIGKIRAFPFWRQWKTLESLFAQNKRLRFHIALPEELLK